VLLKPDFEVFSMGNYNHHPVRKTPQMVVLNQQQQLPELLQHPVMLAMKVISNLICLSLHYLYQQFSQKLPQTFLIWL